MVKVKLIKSQKEGRYVYIDHSVDIFNLHYTFEMTVEKIDETLNISLQVKGEDLNNTQPLTTNGITSQPKMVEVFTHFLGFLPLILKQSLRLDEELSKQGKSFDEVRDEVIKLFIGSLAMLGVEKEMKPC